MALALSMKNIQKSFYSVRVLKGVDLEVGAGEIHALLGENGAGKTTLMNILGGVLTPDSGEIEIFGEKCHELNTKISRLQGIAFVHQELNLVDDLTIYENIFLGEELKNRFGILDVSAMREASRDIMRQLEVEVDVNRLVDTLDASLKQIVEIAKALRQQARLIILDEPTASLTEKEIQQVMKVMRTLKQNGVSMIFISHKLGEALSVCDRYTVLRDGELVATGETSEATENILVQHMVGSELKVERKSVDTNHLKDAPVILEVKDLTAYPLFRSVSFQLRRGEVLGFTGLLGDGHSEVFESVFGIRHYQSGSVLLHGESVTIRHPSEAKHHGFGYIPKNRKQNGIVPDLSVLHNASISAHTGLVIHDKEERGEFARLKELLHIKVANPNEYITSLSGGNQQKVVLSKWIEANAEILILDNPTQGVDVGAKEEIYKLILSLAANGKSFIVLSSEFDEIIRLCDRAIVMYQGSVTGQLASEEFSQEKFMLLSTGSYGEVSEA